jgi:hypothetical protein
MVGMYAIFECGERNSREQTMKICAVVLETTGLAGEKCSVYWDFVKSEFRAFNDVNGAQLTFSSSCAAFVQKQNSGSKILYFDLISEICNHLS